MTSQEGVFLKRLSELNLNHLYYFHVTATRENLTRAAEFLNLSQAALSIQIKKLESQLGLQLFTRNKQRLVLSEQGEIALRYTNEIFKASEEMLDTLNDRRSDSVIKLQIGYQESLSDSEIALLLQRMKIHSKNVEFSLERVQVEQGQQLLSEFKIDLFVATEIPSWPRALLAEKLKSKLYHEEQMYFAHSKDSQNSLFFTTEESFEHDEALRRWRQKTKAASFSEMTKMTLPQGVAVEMMAHSHISGLISENYVDSRPALRKTHVLTKIPGFKRYYYLYTIEKRIKHPVVEALFHK